VVDDGEASDPFMDWAAYTDSFTGKMHERRTIAEWVEETAHEVRVAIVVCISQRGARGDEGMGGTDR
jgi:hypothetical protein